MKDIVYPIFLKCSDVVEDTFWVNIFENMAYGICPSGVHIKNKHVYINIKQKSPHVISLNQDDDMTFFSTLISNMKSLLYMGSEKDDMVNKEIFYRTQDKLIECTNDWSKIRKRSVRNILLENYVSELKTKFKLGIKNTRVILSIIKMYITFNRINSSHIIVKNNKIVDITNCYFDPNKKTFMIQDSS